MLEICFILTVTMLCLYVYLSSHEHEIRLKKRLKTYVGETQPNSNSEKKRNDQSLKKKIDYFRDKGTDFYSKNISSDKEEKLEKSLLQMGNPWGITSVEFHLYLTIFRISLPIVLGIFGSIIGLKLNGIVFLIIAGILASILLPIVYIKSKIKNRYAKALKELPDFIDLLTVSLEAGLGFDLAMNKVVSKTNGILSAEFHTCLEEVRLGKSRREAFLGLKERLKFDSMISLINSILQAEKLGMSMVQIFRIKSQEERGKRRQRAEEAAMKVPVKILFPLVFFIFPCLFIVLLAPALLGLMNGFGK
ncbi:MAG: type II secretion system F family protein [Clostridiaceae bacterium]